MVFLSFSFAVMLSPVAEGGLWELFTSSGGAEIRKEGYIMVVIVVVVGCVENVENSKNSDAVLLFQPFFIHIRAGIRC